MTTKTPTKNIITLMLVIAIIAGGYWLYNKPDERSDAEKLGDALDEISNGFENAGKKLEDKTFGERLTDDVKSTSEEIIEDVKTDDSATNSKN